jgi:hypothetical protein
MMKIATILRAGSLSMDIVNHQSTQQLHGLVRKGLHRRLSQRTTQIEQPSRGGRHSTTSHFPESKHHQVDPIFVPMRNVMKYITPENIKRAQEWHGIVRTFFDNK